MQKLIFILAVVFITSCKRESYKYPAKICVTGHYESYITSGRPVSTSVATSCHKDSLFVCDSFRIDTLIGTRLILKNEVRIR